MNHVLHSKSVDNRFRRNLMLKLPEKQHAVMMAFDDKNLEWGRESNIPFYGIAQIVLKIDAPDDAQIRKIRRTVRLLARKGFLEREYICNPDTGLLCGSGYGLDTKGYDYLRAYGRKDYEEIS